MPNVQASALIRLMTRNPGITLPARWFLSAAETRVVQRLTTGSLPAEIATSLGLSVHTIRTHLKRAMAKAGVHSQAALVAEAYSSKLRG
jgi:DNA-binding CsgD family transcriptional regulator